MHTKVSKINQAQELVTETIDFSGRNGCWSTTPNPKIQIIKIVYSLILIKEKKYFYGILVIYNWDII